MIWVFLFDCVFAFSSFLDYYSCTTPLLAFLVIIIIIIIMRSLLLVYIVWI